MPKRFEFESECQITNDYVIFHICMKEDCFGVTKIYEREAQLVQLGFNLVLPKLKRSWTRFHNIF